MDNSNDMIKGTPLTLDLHGITFTRTPGTVCYNSTPSPTVSVSLQPERETGVWRCTIIGGRNNEFANEVRIMEGSATANGRAISPGDAVRLALDCFSRMTIALAMSGNQLGLTLTPPEDDGSSC